MTLKILLRSRRRPELRQYEVEKGHKVDSNLTICLTFGNYVYTNQFSESTQEAAIAIIICLDNNFFLAFMFESFFEFSKLLFGYF